MFRPRPTLLLALCLTLALGLAAWLRPWWYAAARPLVIVLQAPADAALELRVGSDPTPIRVRPVAVDPASGWSWFWVAEVPPLKWPREARLVFTRGATDWHLASLRLHRTSPEWSKELEVVPQPDQAVDGLRLERNARGELRIHSPAGGGLRLSLPGTAPGWTDPGLLAGVAALALGLGLAGSLVASGLRFAPQAQVRRAWSRRASCTLLGLLLVAGGLHLWISTHSLPRYWPADSTSYTQKGLTLLTQGTYETGGQEYELNRLPGFPALMAVAFRLGGTHLESVVALQSCLVVLGVGLLLWSLRPWVAPSLLCGVTPFVLLSPPLVWASTVIATEGAFAAAWAGATACFLAWAQATRPGLRTAAWLGFCLLTTLACTVRPNGILLLALPGCLGLRLLWLWLRSGPSLANRPSLRTSAWLALPFLAVGLWLAAWSLRNLEARGLARTTDLAPIVRSNAAFYTGLVDSRAAAAVGLEDWFIETRYASGYTFHGWSLRSRLFQQVTDDYRNLAQGTPQALAEAQDRFTQDNRRRFPLRAWAAATARTWSWGLWAPRIGAYCRDPVVGSYRSLGDFAQAHEAETNDARFAWLASTGLPRLELRPPAPSRIVGLWNHWADAYPWWARAWTVAGLGCGLLALARRQTLAWVLLTPYWLNLVLNVGLLYFLGRYVQTLDFALLLGTVAALSGAWACQAKAPTQISAP